MTITAQTNRYAYSGNGSATAFAYSSKFLANADLVVVLVSSAGVETTKTLTTHYTVTGAGDASGGTVTMVTAPASGETLVIYGDPAITQTVDLEEGDNLAVETQVERPLDRLTLIARRLDDRVDRSMRLSDGDASGASVQLPIPEASTLLGWNADGDTIINYAAGEISDDISVTAYMQTVLGTSTDQAAQAALGVSDEILDANGNELLSFSAVASAVNELTIANAAASLPPSITVTGPGSGGRRPLVLEGKPSAGDASYGVGPVSAPIANMQMLIGGFLDYSVSGNALTIAVKTAGSNEPSATDPVYVGMRPATASSENMNFHKITGALSITIPDTTTLGTANDIPFRLWVVIFEDATGPTVQIGVINCCIGTAPNVSVYPLSAWNIANFTAITSGADSAGVFYGSLSDIAAPYVVAGYATWESGLAAAGTWSSGPTRAQLFGPGIRLPGSTVQIVRERFAEVATGTDEVVLDDSIPQLTEGDEYMDASIIPTSAANLIRARSLWNGTNSGTPGSLVVHMHKDATADAFAAAAERLDSAGTVSSIYLEGVFLAGQTTSLDVNVLAGLNAAGTTTFNGSSGARLLGGAYSSFIELEEIMV